MRVVGGDLEGKEVNWQGERRMVIHKPKGKTAADACASLGPSAPATAEYSFTRHVYTLRFIFSEGGSKFGYLAPEHWTDKQAMERLFGEPVL